MEGLFLDQKDEENIKEILNKLCVTQSQIEATSK